MIFSAVSRKKNLNSRKLIVTPTVSATTDIVMPSTIPNINVFAVEKMIAGGKPNAFTNNVSRKLNTIAISPNERIYSAVSMMSPRLNSSYISAKNPGTAKWITKNNNAIKIAAIIFTVVIEAFNVNRLQIFFAHYNIDRRQRDIISYRQSGGEDLNEETSCRIRDETREFLQTIELPSNIGTFELHKAFEVGDNSVEIFSYDSDEHHCKVSAYYDGATHEYKIRIRLGLNEWCLTRFFDAGFGKFIERFRAELETLLERIDRNDLGSNSFIDELNLDGWEYGASLPDELNGFKLFIRPSSPVEFTNGSFIVINYVDFDRARDLVISYNIYSDEFSAEARVDGHTHVLYDFDAKTVSELESKLVANIAAHLK